MSVEINREFCRTVREEITHALAAVGAKHGLKIEAGSASFVSGPGGNIKFQLHCSTLTNDGVANTPERLALATYGRLDGIPDEYLAGKSFSFTRREVRLIGYQTRARKNPYLFEDVATGQKFVTNPEAIKRTIGKANPMQPAGLTAAPGRKITKDHPLFGRFSSLCCQLSPENLHCDGELSHAQAMRRLQGIRAEWAKLEAEAGFPVTEDDVSRLLY